MSDTSEKRHRWRLHGSTWAVIGVCLAAGTFLNVDCVDALYRLKYGPVRPSLIFDGWPFDVVQCGKLDTPTRVHKTRLVANVCVVLAITIGAAVKTEQWRRRIRASFRLASEHLVAFAILAAALVIIESINTANTTVDPIDYIVVFRWPALAVMFIGLSLTCVTAVDLLGLVARRLNR